MNRTKEQDKIIAEFKKNIEAFEIFQKNIRNFFESRALSRYVHSVRHRIKDIDHLIEKIERKNRQDKELPIEQQKGLITAENLFSRITDIAGIRVLHLHSSQLEHIHNALMEKVDDEEFFLVEDPIAYTWNIDSTEIFSNLGITRKVKDSYYTSVHYVLRPNSKSPARCEVQVRTLLEETWGEIDHTMNYPKPTDDIYCREQLRILAKLIGAGSHLADSIMRKYAQPRSQNN